MNLKKLLSFPLLLLFCVVAAVRWYVTASGYAAAPSDMNALVGALKMISDFFLHWIFTPPVWFMITIWSLAGITYGLWLFGDERLIKFSRMLLKKERRISEYKAFADTECVRLFIEEQIAKNVIATARWNIKPLDLPRFKSQEEANAARCHDELYYDGYNMPEMYVRAIIEQLNGITSMSNSLIMEKYRKRIDKAQNSARENNLSWPIYEKGAFFPTPEMRRIWHGRRAGLEEANRILLELKTQLKKYEGKWESAVSEDMREDLFKEIRGDNAD